MVIAVVLVAVGAGSWAFLAPLGCVAMMAVMMLMMFGVGRRRHHSASPRTNGSPGRRWMRGGWRPVTRPLTDARPVALSRRLPGPDPGLARATQ
jgi:hypothetical protein